ncbi:DUF1682-domain-containing protein [Trichodelitschia bisporula]|uniref:DUF1682-domain-containing protein n=1 Tax=Trichodelitschia bisporula TaxID=703511 RepID=A0A6G1HQD0_9PEZI|nr:DUF1682-domain-containing protein [Trichodelitschia bisporula]
MENVRNALFGGQKPVAVSSAQSSGDADFADFAGVPDPSPTPFVSTVGSSPNTVPTLQAAPTGAPYTKWYRVWERTSPSDFKQEAIILPFILLVVLVHLWGTRTNKRRANKWIAAVGPVLTSEFARVGWAGKKDGEIEQMRENSPAEFITYASGRLNVAFLDAKLTLIKRYNPLVRVGELLMGLAIESMPAPQERFEVTEYPFDGKETSLVPKRSGDESGKVPNSVFDGFVWAVVNKDIMRQLREDRYDLSLTGTRDHSKLPAWATVMTESAEITETLLTPELVSAIERAGDLLDALVITDQPVERPTKLNETVPKKRLTLSFRLPSDGNYDNVLPLFQYFIRLPDFLVSHGRFRPEAMRKVRATRDDEIRRIKKIDEEEKAEERKSNADREKKEKRDASLRNMSAEQQRKFLEKEKEKEARRAQKGRTMRA